MGGTSAISSVSECLDSGRQVRVGDKTYRVSDRPHHLCGVKARRSGYGVSPCGEGSVQSNVEGHAQCLISQAKGMLVVRCVLAFVLSVTPPGVV